MESGNRQRTKGGHYCIAPGCNNEYYRLKASKNKTVHLHHLPLKRKTVLHRWLAALKWKNPTVNNCARVCSDHFLDDDYMEEKMFDPSGRLVTRLTNRLKLDAVPSVFNFSRPTHAVGSTDRPTNTASPAKVPLRLKRRQRRPHLVEQLQDHFDAGQFESARADGPKRLKSNAVLTSFASTLTLPSTQGEPKKMAAKRPHRTWHELIQLDHPYCSAISEEPLDDQTEITGKPSKKKMLPDKVGGVPVFSVTPKVLALVPDLTSCNAEGVASLEGHSLAMLDPDEFLSLHVDEAVVTAGDSDTDDAFSGDEASLGPMKRMEFPVPSPDTTCDQEDGTTPSVEPPKKEMLESNADPHKLPSKQLGQAVVTAGDSETDDAFSGDEASLGPMERMEFPVPSPDTTYNGEDGTTPAKLSGTELDEYTRLKKELERLKKEVEELKMYDVWGLGKLSTFTDEAFEMYTGFSCYRDFMAFWQVIEPSVHKMVRVSRGSSRSQEENPSDRYMRESLPPIEEFTMYLMFLSMGAEDLYLAHLFSIPPSTVLCIISLWTNFLYTLLGSESIWLDAEHVRARLPEDYKEDFPDVQAIVDTVEVSFALDPPEEPSKSPMFWSFAHQKYERKMKALIGIAPHGLVTFVSPLCDGSVSDEVLFRRSGLLELLDKDSAIMLPDEELTVPDCVKCKVYRPPPPTMPFCKPSDETKKMIRFWNNAIGVLLRVRDREIFMRTMPSFVAGSFDEVFTVSLLLCNYQNAPLDGPYTRRVRD